MIKNILPFLLVLLAFSACTPKVYPNKNNEHFTPKAAYTQSEIPGQQEAKQRNYLHIKVMPNADKKIVFDSVLFDGKIMKMGGSKGDWKLDRSISNVPTKKYRMKNNDALLFYTVNGKKYQFIISNIAHKEPIYLP